MIEAEIVGKGIYKRGNDPRPEFLNEKVIHAFSQDLTSYTAYWDEELEQTPTPLGYWGDFSKHAKYAAQAKLCGIEPQNPSLFQNADYSLINYYRDYGIPNPEQSIPDAHREHLVAAASGKILGAYIDYDTVSKKNLQESIDKIHGNEITKIYSTQDWWWNLLPYAKILDLDVSIGTEAPLLARSLEYAQLRTMRDFSPPEDPHYSTVHLWWYGALASSLAQARILGLDVPIYDKIIDGIKDTARRQNIEGQSVERTYLETVSNLAIISAHDIKVGRDLGLELIF